MNVRPRMSLPAALLLAALACGGSEAAEEGDVEAVVAVATAVVQVAPFRETVGAIGAVVPRVGSVALLSAPIETRVVGVQAVVGQAVKAGDVLVDFEQDRIQARVQAAEAALQAATTARDRARRLVDGGIAPRKDLEEADAAVAQAQSEAVSARRDARLSRLASPIDGVVTRMDAVLGASVDASQPLVEVADPRAVDVLLAVSPGDAARIRAGARVALWSGQGTAVDSLGVTTVADVGAAVDPETRAVPVRMRASGLRRSLRIGESVTAEITAAEHRDALVIPVSALVPEGEHFTVFVVDGDNVAHATVVRLGGRTATTARVVDGLSAGDRIVTEGAFGVSDGAKIVAPGSRPAADAVETTPVKKDS